MRKGRQGREKAEKDCCDHVLTEAISYLHITWLLVGDQSLSSRKMRRREDDKKSTLAKVHAKPKNSLKKVNLRVTQATTDIAKLPKNNSESLQVYARTLFDQNKVGKRAFYWFQFWIAMLFLTKVGLKFFCPDFNKLLVSLRLLLPTLKDDEECHSPGCFDKQTMHNVQYAGIFTKKVLNTLAQILRNLHLKVASLTSLLWFLK